MAAFRLSASSFAYCIWSSIVHPIMWKVAKVTIAKVKREECS